MTETYANNSTSTLNGNVDGVQTTVTVTSATTFPSSPNFRILIEAEYMLVTGISGSTFTVTRAIEGSTASPHSTGALVSGIITAGALDGITADFCGSGVLASLPSPTRAGRIYQPTDAPFVYRDTGTSWTPGGPTWPLKPIDATADANFSWVNQVSGTVDTSRGFAHLSHPFEGTSAPHMRMISLPTPPFSITAGLIPLVGNVDNPYVGLVFGCSTATTYEFWGPQYGSSNNTLLGYTSTENTAFNGSSFTSQSLTCLFMGSIMWLKVSYDGTNKTYYYSADGYNFIEAYSGNTTSTTPDQVGYFVGTGLHYWQTAVSVVHWEIE